MSTPDPVLQGIAQIRATMQALQSSLGAQQTAVGSVLAALDSLAAAYQPPAPPPPPSPPPPPTGPVVTALSVADGATIPDGTAIVATVSGNPARVDFAVDGGPPHQEGIAPYCIAGDDGTNPNPWHPGIGPHTVVVTPYDAQGKAGTGKAITITVGGSPPPPPPPPPPSPSTAGKIAASIPAYWAGDDGAIQALIDGGAPAGTILCGGAGIRNDVDWRGGYREPFSAEQQRRIDLAHGAGLKVLCYIGIGELQGGVPPSTGGNWNSAQIVREKIAYAFALYPALDGIFLDEFPYSGFAADLATLRPLVRSFGTGKLVVGNAAGWQGQDTEQDNASYVDILNVFESAWDSNQGSPGPYFGRAEGNDGYSEPAWFHALAPARVAAWVYGVPNTDAAIGQALVTAKAQGIGSLYLTDRPFGTYYWAAPPSASFMAKFFAALKAQ